MNTRFYSLFAVACVSALAAPPEPWSQPTTSPELQPPISRGALEHSRTLSGEVNHVSPDKMIVDGQTVLPNPQRFREGSTFNSHQFDPFLPGDRARVQARRQGSDWIAQDAELLPLQDPPAFNPSFNRREVSPELQPMEPFNVPDTLTGDDIYERQAPPYALPSRQIPGRPEGPNLNAPMPGPRFTTPFQNQPRLAPPSRNMLPPPNRPLDRDWPRDWSDFNAFNPHNPSFSAPPRRNAPDHWGEPAWGAQPRPRYGNPGSQNDLNPNWNSNFNVAPELRQHPLENPPPPR